MKKLLLVILNFCFVAAMGQNLISPITIKFPANPPANTAQWATAIPPLIIMAQSRVSLDSGIGGLIREGQVLVTIKSGGNKICGTYTQQTAPASNFNSTVKTWSGSSAMSLLGQDCILPPGTYELCVQFYYRNPATNAQSLAGEACKTFTIAETKQQSFSPPQNIMPPDGRRLTEKETDMPIMFRWTPVVPKPQADVQYKVRVVEILPGQNKTQAIKTNAPIDIIEVKNNTQVSYKLAHRTNGIVWNVEASKRTAMGDIEMLGTSEATGFSVRSVDSTPVKFTAPVNQLPVEGKVFTEKEATQPIVLRWTPVLPRPKADVMYKVRVLEIREGQPRAEALKTNKPVEILEVKNETQVLSKLSKRCNGCEYVWNVEASKRTAMGDVEILGISEATAFGVTDLDCSCTAFDKFTMKPYVQLNGSHIQVDSIDCNGKLSTKLQCNVKYDFAIQYQFLGMWPNNPCGHFDSVVIKNATGTVIASQQHVNPVAPISYTFTQSGNYSITYHLKKNGIICKECTMNFVVECPFPLDCCQNGNWYNKNWYSGGPLVGSNGVGRPPVPLPASGTNLGILPCAAPSYAFHCSFACANNCTGQINYSVYSSTTGTLISTLTIPNTTYASIPAITTNGNYLLVIAAICGKDTCSNKLQYPFEIKCAQQTDCCKNSSWVTRYENSNGRIGVPIVLPACGTKLNSVECNIEKEYFVNYACAQGCGPAQARFQYYNAATNAPVGTAVNAPTQNQTHIFTPGTAGNYYLKIEVFCGGKLCDSCKYPVEVKCTPPVNCCQNATQKDPSVYDATGKNLATFNCLQPKVYYINTKSKNCDKDLILKASANCGPDTSCRAKTVYTLKNTGTGAIISGTGILTIPASLINGSYILTVDYYCGNSICKTCTFEIKKDCKTVVDDCCKNSSWGEKIHYTSGGFTGGAVPKPLPSSGSNLGVVTCGSTKQFKICYNCAQGCGTAQIKYDVYLAYSLVLVSSTTVASCTVANITMPSVSGNYQIRIAAICSGKECNAMDYFINTECKPVDCCKGGKWTNKSLDWDIKIKILQTDAVDLANKPAQKTPVQKQKDQNTPALLIKTPVDLNAGPVNPSNGSIKVEKCGDTLKIGQGGEYSLNASYTCNTVLATCKGKVIAQVKTPAGIIYGTWPLPHLFNFANAGVHTVTYYAYCGETVCDSCTFYVNAERDCCKGSEWKKAEYQITNKKPNGDWDKSDQNYYSLPFTITSPIPVLKADVAIDLERLEYSCAEGCTAGFIIKRKNITTGVEETPEIITAGGTPSVYAKPYPQLITIVPTCGGISCGKPIVFKLECLHKDCIFPVCNTSKYALEFSTGKNGAGDQISDGTVDPFWQTGTSSPGYTGALFDWNKIPGASILIPSGGSALTTASFTRCFYVCQETTVNFSGIFRDDNKVASFQLINSTTSSIVWSLSASSFPTNDPESYIDNPFSGSVLLPKGKYCFVFTLNNVANTKIGFALQGALIAPIPVLSNTEQECCAYSSNSTTTTTIVDTIKICEQIWMKKNLDVATYRNGYPIPQVTNQTQWANLTTGAWCYYNNDPAMGAIYGKLYNWYAINDPRGLAPAGWHIPSIDEFHNLTTCLGGDSLIVGGQLKEHGTSHWLSPNTGTSNSNVLNFLPGGVRSNYGGFAQIKNQGGFWSSTYATFDPNRAYFRDLKYNNTIFRQGNDNKKIGISVRCIKD